MNGTGSRRTWVALGVVAAGAAGCNTTPPPATATDTPVRGDVTDIRPMGRSVAAAVAYEPPLYDTSGIIPVAPQQVTQPAATVATATLPPSPVVFADTAAPTAPPVGHGRTHVVRRGETWFAIARTNYGDGAQWHRIAAANPSAADGPLKVGQKLIVP